MHISQKKAGRKGEMALKLDMSKAYDRVEWVCLEKIMEKSGFDFRWRSLIMRCVTTVSYSFRINGKISKSIQPSRGLRQGDPLSPYLFLIVAEGLSALIKKSVEEGALEVFRLIFCKATLSDCDSLQRIFQVYEKASGQQLNRAKTSLFFSTNTSREIQEDIKNRFGAQVIKQHEKYLGLPSLVGRNKRASFNDIKDKLSKKLAGWKGKLLSKAGKEVLIKAVAQAIPTYTMSCFNIPDSLCDELTTKQGWRLQNGHNSLLFRVLKAKYFPNGDFLNATLGSNPSYTWRSIFSAQYIVKQGVRWRVGNGKDIRIWGDKWLPRGSSYEVISPRIFLHQDTRVSELIHSVRKTWNVEVICQIFLPVDADTILGIPLSIRLPGDRIIWAETNNGCFTVRSAYWVAMKSHRNAQNATVSSDGLLRAFGENYGVFPSLTRFSLRVEACRNILPTKDLLFQRKVLTDNRCDECGSATESTAFEEEKVAMVVTIAWSLWSNRNSVRHGSPKKTPEAIVQWAAHYLQDFAAATVSSSVIPEPVSVTWSPPPPSVLKINVDGALDKSRCSAGIGVVIRDEAGRIVAAMGKQCHVPLGPRS
ncbi:uncharacterized protein LOC136066260 [Quercus suber]|uniref:uncharacterized protein LOC136066260 n=1 Tax=Quercus suber TaxID=58331 RepID=UPI0032DEE924